MFKFGYFHLFFNIMLLTHWYTFNPNITLITHWYEVHFTILFSPRFFSFFRLFYSRIASIVTHTSRIIKTAMIIWQPYWILFRRHSPAHRDRSWCGQVRWQRGNTISRGNRLWTWRSVNHSRLPVRCAEMPQSDLELQVASFKRNAGCTCWLIRPRTNYSAILIP
jgi:hypothetical protein